MNALLALTGIALAGILIYVLWKPFSRASLFNGSVKVHYDEEPRYGDRFVNITFFKAGVYTVTYTDSQSLEVHEAGTFTVKESVDDGDHRYFNVPGEPHTIILTVEHEGASEFCRLF